MFRNLKQDGQEGALFSTEKGTVWDRWIKTYHKISLSSIRYVTSHCSAEELLWPQVLLSSPEQMFLVWKVGPQSRQYCCTGQPGVSETHSSQGNSCASWYKLSEWVFHWIFLFLPFPCWAGKWRCSTKVSSEVYLILFFKSEQLLGQITSIPWTTPMENSTQTVT